MEHWELYLRLGIPLVLLVIGLFSGTWLERRHYRSIQRREREVRSVPVTNLKRVPDGMNVRRSWLASSGVVISIDSFKSVLAGLQSFFGGEVGAYETLVDRARREAVLRMHAEAAGADLILNLRIETAPISQGDDGSIAGVEAFAYATAVELER